MNKYQEIKEEIKTIAVKIRKTKEVYKESQRQREQYTIWCTINKLYEYRYEYRHRHIAMSIIRGTKREEIERPAFDNQPSEIYIKQLVEDYEQTLRPDA